MPLYVALVSQPARFRHRLRNGCAGSISPSTDGQAVRALTKRHQRLLFGPVRTATPPVKSNSLRIFLVTTPLELLSRHQMDSQRCWRSGSAFMVTARPAPTTIAPPIGRESQAIHRRTTRRGGYPDRSEKRTAATHWPCQRVGSGHEQVPTPPRAQHPPAQARCVLTMVSFPFTASTSERAMRKNQSEAEDHGLGAFGLESSERDVSTGGEDARCQSPQAPDAPLREIGREQDGSSRDSDGQHDPCPARPRSERPKKSGAPRAISTGCSLVMRLVSANGRPFSAVKKQNMAPKPRHTRAAMVPFCAICRLPRRTNHHANGIAREAPDHNVQRPVLSEPPSPSPTCTSARVANAQQRTTIHHPLSAGTIPLHPRARVSTSVRLSQKKRPDHLAEASSCGSSTYRVGRAARSPQDASESGFAM